MRPDELKMVMDRCVYYGHPWFRKGTLVVGDGSSINYYEPGIARIELTGDVIIGRDCMIGAYVKIYTHDHFHKGRDKTMFQMFKEKGVKWSKLIIEDDVWIHEAHILSQVTHIPKGCVIGDGAVLTKNPTGPYEVWAGNPARKVGER